VKFKLAKILDGAPTRELIIKTITKDISIEAAIFDLIDNSIHAAEIINSKKFNKFYVKLDINKNKLIIQDNCGGIPRDKAWGDAFRLGSSLEYKAGHGIGMKRAFLKLGKVISIKSNRKDYSCSVPIFVDSWGYANNWDISIEEKAFSKHEPEGVIITINELYDDIVRNFSKSSFIQKLKDRVARRYRYKLMAGFNIIINGEIIISKNIQGEKVAESPNKLINNMMVKVILYNNIPDSNNGWDIIINGNVIIERDKSDLTMWRKRLIIPKYSYEKFVGEVLISGVSTKDLPILSTKDNIDTDAKSYEDILNYVYKFVDENRRFFMKDDVIIQYRRPSFMVEQLKNCLGNLQSAKEVGEETFDKVYNYYCIHKNDW
jgi:hypothetical protein